MRLSVKFGMVCFVTMFGQGAWAQALSEQAHWDLVKDTQDLALVEDFIATFPEGALLFDALRLTIGLKEDAQIREQEAMIFASIGPVRYGDALQFGTEAVMGRSFDDILRTAPTYPPVEGLPEPYWKVRSCHSCHDWSRDTLCTQAQTYVDARPARYREKRHPFGGTFKINLRNWAMNGCQ